MIVRKCCVTFYVFVYIEYCVLEERSGVDQGFNVVLAGKQLVIKRMGPARDGAMAEARPSNKMG